MLADQSDLILSAQAGDLDARNKLIETNLGFIRYCAYRTVGKDRVAEYLTAATLGFMRAIEQYDPKKGALTTFAFWKIRCTVSEQMRRHNGNEHRIGCRPIHEGIADKAAPENLQFDLRCDVADCVAELPERERLVIGLRMQGWHLKAIGDQINVSKGRVHQLVTKAHARLRTRLLCSEKT